MAFCTECGTNIPDGIQFCTNCGKPMKKAEAPVKTETPVVETPTVAVPVPSPVAPPPPPAAQPVASPAPVYAQPVNTGEQPPPAGSPYAVMSIGSYIGSSLLMSIPFIGFLICIIWACGGCKNYNRRNFARATLILSLIAVAIITIIMIVLMVTMSSVFYELMSEFTEAMSASNTVIIT